VPEELNRTAEARALQGIDREYFRYQLVGTWGGVFFPQHWREFLIWLREKQFVNAEGISPIFQPCVPGLIGNDWWKAKPHKVWSQWFARFAFEKGWYNLYTNFPDQLSLVGNFREGGENFAVAKGLMNEMVDNINTPPGSPLYERIHTAPLPVPTSKIPLYDFHFNEQNGAGAALKSRLAVWGNPLTFPNQCITMKEYSNALKEAREKEKAKVEQKKKEEADRAKEAKKAAADAAKAGAKTTTRDKIEDTLSKLNDKKAAAGKDTKKAAAAAADKKAAAASKDKKAGAAAGKDAAAKDKKAKDAKPAAAAAKKDDKKKPAASTAAKDKKPAAAAAKKPAAPAKKPEAKAKAAPAAKKPTAAPAKKKAKADDEEAEAAEVSAEETEAAAEEEAPAAEGEEAAAEEAASAEGEEKAADSTEE